MAHCIVIAKGMSAMPALMSALKNEHIKRILRATRVRPAAVRRGPTAR